MSLKGQEEAPFRQTAMGFFMPNEAGECDMDDTLKKRTLFVNGGARRSQYGEVSEAMFLTQGFVCETA